MNYMPVTVNSILVALGSKLVPPTQESEIIWKLFAGICTVEKKKVLVQYMVGGPQEGLENSDSKLEHIRLNCLKLHQSDCSGYIETIPDYLDPDVTAFLIHDIIAMVSYVLYAKINKWFFNNYCN